MTNQKFKASVAQSVAGIIVNFGFEFSSAIFGFVQRTLQRCRKFLHGHNSAAHQSGIGAALAGISKKPKSSLTL